ncbi:hypothetical protein PHYSODRAFT_500985, partial [Phytophthora sojae]
EGQELVANECFYKVCPLPSNSISVCQPLYVWSYMPTKAKYPLFAACGGGQVKTVPEKRLAAERRAIAAWEP